MLLIRRIVEPHGYQNEKDEERPHDLNQQLDLREETSGFLWLKPLNHFYHILLFKIYQAVPLLTDESVHGNFTKGEQSFIYELIM